MRNIHKHYRTEDWVDFVMNQVPQNQMSEMQKHLDLGCKKCIQSVSLWSRVGQVTKRVSALEPPASAVHHVRAAFSVVANSNRLQVPTLTFDSLWQPALAGIRASSSTSRHVMYAANRLSIDMRLESESRSERIHLAGQVSLTSVQDQDYAPIPVVVSGKAGSLAATTTNGFGEFHLSFVPEQGLQISFAFAGKEDIVIPLDSSIVRGK